MWLFNATAGMVEEGKTGGEREFGEWKKP